MIDLDVRVVQDDLTPFLTGFSRQVPYMTALAINNTLKDVQVEERAHIREEFTLRRPEFVERTVYIGRDDWANKDRAQGTVRINPQRDMLAKFESDTFKRPRTGKALAVPVFREADRSRVIGRGDPLNVAKLMAALQKSGKIGRRRPKGMQGPLARQTVFLVKSQKGTFLVERTYSTTRVLWSFEREVPIEPVLEFKATGLDAALRAWPDRAAEAIARAIETAR